jgi:hypothetical protein
VSPKRLEELGGDMPASTFRLPTGEARSKLKRAYQRQPRPGGYNAAREWRELALWRVYAEHGRIVDEVTGENLDPIDAQVHHVLEVSHLNAAGFGQSEAVIWNVDNALVVHRRTHERHHSYTARIPFDRLRDHHHAFAQMLDDTQGTDAWSMRIARDYPTTPEAPR